MTPTVATGPLPRIGTMLTAGCARCGGTFRALVDPQDAPQTGVDHRCSTGVVGPLWTLVQPPAVRRRARPSVENVA